MTEHLSRHHLEQLIAGERESGPRASTRAELQARSHVLGCDVCTTRKRSIETARTRFLAARPADEFVRTTLARAANAPAPPADGGFRARAGRWAVGGGALAAAAAALLWIQAPHALPARDGIRLKGTPALEVFVKRGAHVAPIRDGDALARGDQLGFAYTLSEPRHLLLLGVDSRGVITRYFPSQGAAAPALAAGARVQLPLGVELDDQRGEERLIAFFAPTPPDEATARRALVDALERAQREGRGLAGLEPLDLPAQQASIWFRKP